MKLRWKVFTPVMSDRSEESRAFWRLTSWPIGSNVLRSPPPVAKRLDEIDTERSERFEHLALPLSPVRH
jgi:hypothetical protein